MSAAVVLGPVFLQVALTLSLLVWSGTVRVRSVRSGVVHSRDIALGQRNWPPRVTQIGNSFQNQFELPVLFYLVVVLALLTGRQSLALVILSWLFVASRGLHALIHVTTNNVPRRFMAYVAGLAILAAMWLIFAAEILFGGSGA